MKRSEFKIHDTFHYFQCTGTGLLALRCPSNLDLEDGEFFPVQRIDSTWPACIPDEVEEFHEPMKFPIEDNVNLPDRFDNEGLYKDVRETMADLKVGQSFFIPIGERKVTTIRSAIDNAKKKISTSYFVSRKHRLRDTETDGIRIWRIE